MDFAINTGDIIDNQQFNEAEWARTLMEGGTLDPGSGVVPAASGNLSVHAARGDNRRRRDTR